MMDVKQSGAPLQFVCPTCWYVFNNEALPACEGCGAVAPEQGFPTMPYEFLQYLFVEQLGRGGMGAVFRAYDRRAPDRPWVAVKVAQLHGTDEDRSAKERAFAREVRAAAALSEYSKYFVGFRAADFNGKPAYLALDYIDWPTLQKLKAQLGNVSPVDVARIGAAILRGIRWMERKNIVHRDLKPANIFVRRSPDGTFEAKIADLGIWVDAGTSEDSLLAVTDVTHIVGSPSYMSPEQTRGGALAAASDIHAVGSILWELTTGAVPYPVNRSLSLVEALRERHERMRKLPAQPVSMPRDLYDLLSSALQFEPGKRIFTDGDVSHAPEFSIARWMEKALDKFAADYIEQQRQALAAAVDRLGALDRSITASDARLTPAILLADRARQLRARINSLRSNTLQPNLPDVVTALSSEVDGVAQEVAQLFDDRDMRQPPVHVQDLTPDRIKGQDKPLAAQSATREIQHESNSEEVPASRMARRSGLRLLVAGLSGGLVAGSLASYLSLRSNSTPTTTSPSIAMSTTALSSREPPPSSTITSQPSSSVAGTASESAPPTPTSSATATSSSYVDTDAGAATDAGSKPLPTPNSGRSKVPTRHDTTYDDDDHDIY